MDLSQRQRDLLFEWLPDAEVVTDRSWGQVGTTVLEVMAGGSRYIAKAGNAQDHHLARELLLLTRFMPGELVQGSAHERLPETYRQAGGIA
ncbi:hypothetical protein AB0L70_05295 [Kribbella sp. NPDC051952]|uniref:hypothetical protein n=1 Tax=Kribbella sp. NPDC051952 TaxID=3154851 RepID=UPI003420F1F5